MLAVLWDMDGTLVDSEPEWVAAEAEMVAEYGGRWTEADALQQIGNDLIVTARYLRDVAGVPGEPEAIVEELLDRVAARLDHEVPWRPGALELLTAVRAAGVPCALVTMSYRRFVDPILATLPPDTFGVVVTGDEVDCGKPHPEPYLAAARALGVDPSRTVAIEDSSTGTESAEAAGCTVLVVPNHVTVAPGPRRIFVETLVGLSLADLPVPVDPAATGLA